ncbi:MAG: hypothetical protein E3J87_01405 [Candidatus Cloacimonadota bacterium]|nr:MAG: hypothetical protein E3J87_01405 [Candidatus Cloacimonadota bacterium]
MKPLYTILFVFLILLAQSNLFAQTEWSKYDNNPVMVKENIVWETFAIGQPTCIMDNDTIKMWYAAAGLPYTARISYAYSVDGINWIKYNDAAPVLDVGAPGEWDSGWLDTPEILKDPFEYKLYYFGDTTAIDTTPPFGSAIGLATSSDGINWEKYASNPVFEKGDSSSWDGLWIESPALLFENDTFKMWYTGVDYDYKVRIGYATSLDGKVWTKHSANPVLDLGAPGTWEDYWVGVPAVIKTDIFYEIWYSGVSAADLSNGGIDTIRIGYATSTDGISWTKYSGNPVLSTFDPPYNPPIDSGGPWAADVVFTGTEYWMWYETKAGFCLATAPVIGIAKAENQDLENRNLKLKIYPNPFTTFTTIILSLSSIERRAEGNSSAQEHRCTGAQVEAVELRIYDVSGRLVKNFSLPTAYSLLPSAVSWDGRGDAGQKLPIGVYFCKLSIGKSLSHTKKIMLVR